ncbi:MAG: type II toxin-antitoxin system RelE/ParE family toxin [Nanoarchaeota archaeon]|nr:type II toxin-antitoxin system RelE/ParE family toxin [Nanoarchaeota archaeon]
MVNVRFDDNFQRAISKIKDQEIQKSIKNKIKKIIENPEIGKPRRNVRKGTREVYVGGESFRISYNYYKEQDLIEFLDFYHKDGQ